ncbi:hypothetical protein HAX54_017584 [Datura stramonium]|uniref:Uncharacterized protein n=1 Tax=Datura stramonium TaxID=4076 RepID=A0ABS8S0I4_DATST|nr:hypothetical protein [Datura stramonium]
MSETIYANGDHPGESIKRDVVEVEVSGYHDIENSMMYNKKPITLEQVQKAQNSSDCRGILKETEMMKQVGSL